MFFWWGLRWSVFKSWLTGNDFNSLQQLKEYGRKRGFTLSEAQWEELNWRWYAGLADIGGVSPQTVETLRILRDKGLKLGMLSNTFIHKSSLERHLAQTGLLDYLPVRLYTYEFPWRKPDERIFRQAAEAVGAACDRIIYVGDRIDNDVIGARKVGMLPVLIRAYTNENKRMPRDVAFIDSLAELPNVIDQNCHLQTPNTEAEQPAGPKG